ncbi:MAG: hypothetical protein H7Y02_08500 [Candidatus Obscuribacterales bacterium]|nr:hypothetical protein [Steroidobacteraceae bacterium]
MKISARIRLIALAAIVVAPLAAHSDDNQTIQSCIDAFVAKNFADQAPTTRIENDYASPLPLIAQNRAQRVKLVASYKASRRVLMTATCNGQDGTVTVLPAAFTRIATR